MKQAVIIVMPAYNEGPRIAKVITSIPNEIKIGKRTFATRVVVVDDCSSDNTIAEATKAGATVLKHVMNSGAGAATRTGLKYADQYCSDVGFVVTIDSDGQHTAEDIQRMVQHALDTRADLVVGNRLHEGNKQDMPFHRVVGNLGLSFISRLLFGIKTKDTQSGLRLFAPGALPILSDYTVDRYGFCTEMLWLAHRAKLTVSELPIGVKYFKDTLEKGQNNWGAVLLIKDLLWIRMNN